MNEYYSGEQLGNCHKKCEGKFPLFCGNVEPVIPIYASKVFILNILAFDETTS